MKRWGGGGGSSTRTQTGAEASLKGRAAPSIVEQAKPSKQEGGGGRGRGEALSPKP